MSMVENFILEMAVKDKEIDRLRAVVAKLLRQRDDLVRTIKKALKNQEGKKTV